MRINDLATQIQQTSHKSEWKVKRFYWRHREAMLRKRRTKHKTRG